MATGPIHRENQCTYWEWNGIAKGVAFEYHAEEGFGFLEQLAGEKKHEIRAITDLVGLIECVRNGGIRYISCQILNNLALLLL